ncbi:AMP-binding protein [Bradyrhizobium sp. SZCCHNRI1009]|uniref:AMP-binding protein n=1 Tax=Bradyrhizobium sp. SZCCHNRI1009 TaxID=3057277 RepID=UPI0029168609|nr:AMP-binding protein [Bradyrhizobium sp. SZCCHNRI1009]
MIPEPRVWRDATFTAALRHHARLRTGPAIRLMRGGSESEDLDYSRLAALAGGTACALTDAGVRAGDRVAVVMTSSLPVIVVVNALFAIGAALLPIAHRPGLKSGSHQFDAIIASLRAGMPSCVLLPKDAIDTYQSLVARSGIERWICLDELVGTESELPPQSDADAPKLIQFSSGTTSAPKAIVISEDRLISNVRAILERIEASANDRLYSWLPLYHDMGLVGGLLTTLYVGASMTLALPFGFVRNPLSWAESISLHRCTLTLGPPSAFALLAAKGKVNPDRVTSLDLSSLRLAMTGSEMVPPDLSSDFQSAFSAARLRDHVLQPCYGLAENAVAVTLRRPGQPWSVAHFARTALHESRVELRASAGDDSVTRVGNGGPVEGTEVMIGRIQDGAIVSSDCGDLFIRGTSTASAVIDHSGEPLPPYKGGWIATGDLAVMINDELFIVGRTKELIKYGGQSFAPTDVERSIAAACGLRDDTVAVVPIFDQPDGRESFAIFIEAPNSVDNDALVVAARQAVVSAFKMAAKKVILLRSGELPRTSSGKIKRSLLGSSLALPQG